jgi:bifunctional enzyme CysN/CysC
MASGALRLGDDVVVLPAGHRTTVSAIDTFDGSLQEAAAPRCVTMRLAEDHDVSRGDLICRANNQPAIVGELTLNDIGCVRLRLAAPLAVDAYRRNRATGSFIVIDETTNETVAGGMVLASGPHRAGGRARRSTNVVWSPSTLTRAERWRSLAQSGATLWLTGLPASGKSTLATEVERRLVIAGRAAYRLDGDNLRHGLNGDLGFDAASRSENVRRTAHVAALLADAGAVAIVSLVSPYATDRAAARAVHEQLDIPFVEIFVDTPLQECERRDPKGLYAQARRGEIQAFTGISDPYEAPEAPEARVAGHGSAIEDQVTEVIAALERKAPRIE